MRDELAKRAVRMLRVEPKVPAHRVSITRGLIAQDEAFA